MHPDHEAVSEHDPDAPLFGLGDDDAHDLDEVREPRRSARRHQRVEHTRRRRHRRLFILICLIVVAVLAAVGVTGYQIYQRRYHPADYSGAAGSAVLVKVADGDGADAIAATLVADKVVASTRAFINAAKANPASGNISPGTYRIQSHLPARTALTQLLAPGSKVDNGVVVFEGATVVDVESALAKGLNVPMATVKAAVGNVGALNLPTGYSAGSAAPSSAEGFLFPATYSFDAGTTAAQALTQMVSRFITEDRTIHFAQQAQGAGLSPYEALIIASIAEKEAKMPADFPKVARVILNRIAANMPLQIDATSAYAAKLANLDPTKVIYSQIDSPYNTYTHPGLPPTPIASPGDVALQAAVQPTAGNWLYYVNIDKAGDLGFFDKEADFETAVAACRANNWGCG